MGKRAKSDAGERAEPSAAGELPRGWCWATVGEVCTSLDYGLTASAKHDGTGPKMLRITDIDAKGVDWSTVPRCDVSPGNYERFLLADDDIVFARTGATTGKSYRIRRPPTDAVFASYLIRLRLDPCVALPGFLALFFASPDYWESIAGERAGIAQPNVNGSKLASLRFPLPPLAEQRRIVAKLEALLGRIRRAREALDAVPAMVERYKKSVLGAAFQPGSMDESRDYVDLVSRRTLRVPAHWPMHLLGDCTESGRPLCYGIVQPGEPVVGGRRMIRVLDIDDHLSIDVSSLRTVSEDVDEAFARSRVRAGDVLVTVVGTIGRIAVVGESLEGVNIARAVARLSPNAKMLPRWLAWWLSSPWMSEWLRGSAVEVARATLNLKELARAYVPLPPLDEQRAIVARIDAAFARARAMLSAADAARAQLDVLERSVLAKAFRGELVEQDPADEPASVMLDRVRAERAKSGAPAKKPRKPRASA